MYFQRLCMDLTELSMDLRSTALALKSHPQLQACLIVSMMLPSR